MKFCIQDPLYTDSFLLHESLLNSCKNAIYGGGTYAFVTADGVNLFLGDKIFSEFIKMGKYTLIVGMDEITSTKTLSKLEEMKSLYGDNIEIYAFLHNTKGSTYHPKYSWFKTENGGILVLGSGNLTQKGLRKNREAFNIIELDESGINDVESQWHAWFEFNKEFMKQISDPDVIEKAEENAKNTRWIKTRKVKKTAELSSTDDEEINSEEYGDNDIEKDVYRVMSGTEEDDAWYFELENEVLFAEIPKSKDRWKQANFDKYTFENYFGAKSGQNGEYRILLRNIDKLGLMGDVEVRPAVSVASQNYRFELNAASGLSYPDNNRPIAVFVKISNRTFLYELFMPGDENYESILEFINEKSSVTAKLRRIIVRVEECFEKLPDLSLWNNLIDDEDFI